jgi:hypothetical protein
MRNWVLDILVTRRKGTDLPFVAIHLASGRVAGATRYLNIMPKDRGLEIGGTWYGPEFQRTPVNTECKYLLLRHAFETLGCIRVQLKTDLRNERSQKAIERIGAVKEGVLRNHMILPDGGQGDGEGAVAVGCMDYQVGGGAARRGRQQDNADGIDRREGEGAGNGESECWEQDQLTEQSDRHLFGLGEHAFEVGQGQSHAQCHHDDDDGEGKHYVRKYALLHVGLLWVELGNEGCISITV